MEHDLEVSTKLGLVDFIVVGGLLMLSVGELHKSSCMQPYQGFRQLKHGVSMCFIQTGRFEEGSKECTKHPTGLDVYGWISDPPPPAPATPRRPPMLGPTKTCGCPAGRIIISCVVVEFLHASELFTSFLGRCYGKPSMFVGFPIWRQAPLRTPPQNHCWSI